MHSPWAKAAAILIGVFLLLFAVAMLMEGSGFVQSGRNNALAYLIGLVGLGLIAAAFFGDTLKYDGDGKGPLGKIIATGGAAVFVIGLIFILTIKDGPAQPTIPAPSPVQTPGAIASQAAPLPVPADPASGTGPTQAAIAAAPAAVPAAPPPVPLTGQAMPDVEMMGEGFHFAWTYCSQCCPQGPETCPHTSYGVAASAQQAATTAILYCTGSGGTEQSCRDNVNFMSEDELAL